jgi:hypothetical protein
MGTFSTSAMAMARLAASPSTAGGRDSGWPSGPGDAHLQHLLLQQKHQFAVLGVHGGHGAQLQRALEAVHQRFVVAHDGVLVGHEVLEAVHALVADQCAHVTLARSRPTR